MTTTEASPNRVSSDLAERVERVAAAAPPLTDQQRARLAALLRPITTVVVITRKAA
jgi:hypothetical protein